MHAGTVCPAYPGYAMLKDLEQSGFNLLDPVENPSSECTRQTSCVGFDVDMSNSILGSLKSNISSPKISIGSCLYIKSGKFFCRRFESKLT